MHQGVTECAACWWVSDIRWEYAQVDVVQGATTCFWVKSIRGGYTRVMRRRDVCPVRVWERREGVSVTWTVSVPVYGWGAVCVYTYMGGGAVCLCL